MNNGKNNGPLLIIILVLSLTAYLNLSSSEQLTDQNSIGKTITHTTRQDMTPYRIKETLTPVTIPSTLEGPKYQNEFFPTPGHRS